MYLVVLANSDLTAGRFALFMDERITFDGVKRILHPNGVIEFLGSILHGGDQRYGRSLWNSMAIFSFIPEKIFGESGQIIASRMLQFFLIFTSYCIVAFGHLRSWFLRFVLLVAMLSFPFSDYYMTMPKPEPLQLLFLAIFCYFFIKNNAEFSWYWIFAGLAFGTKISTLPAILVFISIPLAVKIRTESFSSYKKPLVNAAVAFVLGLAIAVPILSIPVLMSLGGYYTFNWLSKKFNLNNMSRISLATMMIILIFFASRRNLKVWLSYTFFNTTHGADQASINVLSWLNYFFDEWLVAPHTIGLVFSSAILVYLLFHGIQLLKSKNLYIDKKMTVFAVIMAGLALNIAIIISAKRLWGFYLYPGTMLLVIGTIILIDLNISEARKSDNELFLRFNKLAGYFISLFFLVVSGLYWMPKTSEGLKKLSLRTSTTEYALQYASYKKFTDFLNHYKIDGGKRLRVMFTPSLFPPNSSDKFEIVEFWGPFVEWGEKPDIIIFGVENTPRGKPTPKDSPNYHDFLIEREGYAAYVVNKEATCQNTPCFVRELELPNGGEILILNQ
jgi:hypothetical protein